MRKVKLLYLFAALGLCFTLCAPACAVGDFVVKDGVLTQYRGRGGDVVIPAGVREIGDAVFYKNERVESVTLPEGLVSIGCAAFNGTSIRELILPEGLREIGYSAFGDCALLERAYVPDSVCELPDAVFYRCTSLRELVLPEGVKAPGSLSFYGCASLESVENAPGPWAESIALFEREARSTPVLVADIGYLSSFAAVGVGFGLEDLASFSVGRGHIAAEIYEKLGVPYDLAERALELVDLNLAYSPTDILVADGGTHAVHAADAAETVRGVLRELAEFVSSVAENNNYPLRSTVYLTGDGITSLRGADKFLSEQIGRNVEICAPKLAGFNKPADSSEAALIIVAEQLRAESFGHQIKRAISGGKL